MVNLRLDQLLLKQGKVTSRSQAENYIKLGKVKVDGLIVDKPSKAVDPNSVVVLTAEKTYVSRAALKLESVVALLELDFNEKSILDVGSSTGGFTDFVLSQGAAKVIAVDVGTNQMDAKLKMNSKIELHERTDIRNVSKLSTNVDFVLIDVSFISIKEVLVHLPQIINKDTKVIAMVKPQFESSGSLSKHKGVIKNENIRRKIMKDFEHWAKNIYKIIDKADSKVSGQKGNREKFYLLKLLINKKA